MLALLPDLIAALTHYSSFPYLQLLNRLPVLLQPTGRQPLHLQELLEANANLQTFAYAAGHDLRSLLRSIHNFSSMLLEDFGPGLGPEGQMMLERVSIKFMPPGVRPQIRIRVEPKGGSERLRESVSGERSGPPSLTELKEKKRQNLFALNPL